MKVLKKLSATVALTLALGWSAFAGCPPPDPGILECPPSPCATAQLNTDDSATPGQTETPSANALDDITNAAVDVFGKVLSIL